MSIHHICNTYILCFLFRFTAAFVYFGLSLNIADFGGNRFVNFSLSGLVEIPAYLVAWFLPQKIGRIWTYFGSLLACAIPFLCITAVPSGETFSYIYLSDYQQSLSSYGEQLSLVSSMIIYPFLFLRLHASYSSAGFDRKILQHCSIPVMLLTLHRKLRNVHQVDGTELLFCYGKGRIDSGGLRWFTCK